MNDNMKEYLCHMTDAEKKAYNAEYYRNHKNYWQDYYSKGQTVGRPTARQKYVTEGNGQGVERRGFGTHRFFSRERTGGPTPPKGALRRYGGSENFGYHDNEMYKHGTLPEDHPNRKNQKEYEAAREQTKNAWQEVERYRVLYGDYRRETDRLNKQYKLEKDKTKKEYIWRQMQQYQSRREEADKDKTRAYNEYLNGVDAMNKALDNYKRTEAQLKATSQQHENRPGTPSAQVNSEAFSNAYAKAEKKEKVKKTAKQAYSDWNSGAKSIAKTAASSVNSGKKALSSLLSKFK